MPSRNHRRRLPWPLLIAAALFIPATELLGKDAKKDTESGKQPSSEKEPESGEEAEADPE